MCKRLLFVFFVLLAVILSGMPVSLAEENPPSWHDFIFSLTIDGERVSPGTVVEAYVGGVKTSEFVTTTPIGASDPRHGVFHVYGTGVWKPGEQAGLVTFTVNGWTAQTEPSEIIWEGFGFSQISIIVNTLVAGDPIQPLVTRAVPVPDWGGIPTVPPTPTPLVVSEGQIFLPLMWNWGWEFPDFPNFPNF